MATPEQKEAYGERFSQIDVTETNETSDKLMTDESKKKELRDLKPELPTRRQKKLKFSK